MNNTPTLHAPIMNLPFDISTLPHGYGHDTAYVMGHRDARHAAAELANEADATIDTLRAALQTQAEEAAKLMEQRDGLLIDMRRARNLLENGERAGALNCLGDAITNATTN